MLVNNLHWFHLLSYEILADKILSLDIEDTVDKFDLRHHVITSLECLGGGWNEDENERTVQFRDLQTSLKFSRHTTVFISAVGATLKSSFSQNNKNEGQ